MPAKYPENELFAKWKSSNAVSRELILPSLVSALQKHARSVCWLRIPDHVSEHEWVTQEAVWRAISGLSKFRNEALFGTWFHRIVINECSRLLKLKERAKQEIPLAEASQPMLHGKQDSKIQVGGIIASLNEDDRILVKGRLEGFSFLEIGEILDITAGAARARWQKIKAELK
jgi:RNA polymerase sigma-70 factor (ECF subfamily)